MKGKRLIALIVIVLILAACAGLIVLKAQPFSSYNKSQGMELSQAGAQWFLPLGGGNNAIITVLCEKTVSFFDDGETYTTDRCSIDLSR